MGLKRIAAMVLLLVNTCWHVQAQTIKEKLTLAVQQLQADSPLLHASMSLYVVNSATGEPVFDWNSQLGLAPASCQKIFTSVAAFDVLGPEYQYKTYFTRHKDLHTNGNDELVVGGSYDPTFGSWRYTSVTDSAVFPAVATALQAKGLQQLGRVVVPLYTTRENPVPDGYTWSDMGNYYGSAIFAFNWHENQYDLVLRSDSEHGAPPVIVSTRPEQKGVVFYDLLRTGVEGSGDNTTIYASPFAKEVFVRGTIPPNKSRFIISGSMTNPAQAFGDALSKYLTNHQIRLRDTAFVQTVGIDGKDFVKTQLDNSAYHDDTIYTHYSPTLDSINYWFLKKSVNLYGEALLKTLVYKDSGFTSTELGIAFLKKYWQERGISRSALHIIDGSGLSPQNRVTTNALVTALQYARARPWFHFFYDALPVYNGMKLKSGSIGGARSFAGYHTAADGTNYTVAIIINNYDGSAGATIQKLFSVLDVLK
ncbi:D-alanyl-D-alaninecarboxypeptidase/D-alanyl-D-alanine-endopeptidase [Russula earlei]|uniref:D-alanyl-D-alaninecarboxypeptidase/D-alanyl-D-alanine-endopeptidase n=1 Tax=Russula earlei TaxID=71964 RepID=A0ACC0TSQ8_9AGAM|nr:D-alanyl-D-alaninecarboxypeptidase/D-alanyl-D-alanine-endopeptidase [Russula earlei]